MLVAMAAPNSFAVASGAAAKGNWFLASPERLRRGDPSAFLALVERGNRRSCKTCWPLGSLPTFKGVKPLSVGVSNRKGVFWPNTAFWAAIVVSVITGARIRVTVWALGLDVLAAVKPDEM